MQRFDTYLSSSTFFQPVPGPDRKRTVKPYLYNVTFCNDNPDETGCVVVFEVMGGRVSYQVALEREEDGNLRWHCTCADAVYRGHTCKHIRGLLSLGRPTPEPMTCTAAAA